MQVMLQAKNKVSGEGVERGREGALGGKGGKWVSVFILLSLIPQGHTNRQELSRNPQTDVRAHCLFQLWQKGSTGHLSSSLLHLLIPSSLYF